MTGLDPANQLAALIRVQVAALRRGPDVRSAAGRKQAAAARNAAPLPDLASVVSQRIRSIARDDPQRERKAFRLFLEAMLLAELGQELVGDPDFALMLDHVQGQLEGDAELAKASTEAARLLLKSADAAS